VRPLPTALALAVALALSSGCGPLRSSEAIDAAAREIAEARAAGAAGTAPYPLAAAEASLRLAREEEGRARYGSAAELAGRAREQAAAARRQAEGSREEPAP